jgi:small conductance mechanosensitive channel
MYARARQLREHAAERAKRARTQVALLLPLITAVVLAYTYRKQLFGLDVPVRIACTVAIVILGWSFAMNLGRAVGPTLLRRLDPGTAGTVGFLIMIVRVRATPVRSEDGSALADQVVAALNAVHTAQQAG